MGLFGGLIDLITGHNPQADAANAASSQATAAQNQIIQQLLPVFQQQLGNYQQTVQPLEQPLSQGFGSLLGSATTGGELGQLAPDIIQQLLSGGVTGNGQGPGVGSQALQYYLLQAQNGGIDPRLIQGALGQQQQGFDQSLNDLRNVLGGATNLGSLEQNLSLQNDQARAQLIGQLTGQSQQLRNQSMGSALGVAQGIDQQRNQNALSAAGLGGQVDTQRANLLGDVGNYLTGTQQNTLTPYLAGMEGLSSQYGQAAGQAAQNAQNAYNSQNQMWASLLGAGAQYAGARSAGA